MVLGSFIVGVTSGRRRQIFKDLRKGQWDWGGGGDSRNVQENIINEPQISNDLENNDLKMSWILRWS